MNRPAAVEITYGCMRFLITHNPTDATLNKFTEVRPRAPASAIPTTLPGVFSSLSFFFLLSGAKEIPRKHTGASLRCHL